VDFGGNDPQILVILLADALVATAMGACIAALPMPEAAMGGVASGVTAALSVFAGLYGPGSQRLGDALSRAAPWTDLLDPARGILRGAVLAVHLRQL
jgi:hypothetical protein